MSNNQQELSRDEINEIELEKHLKSRQESISLLMKAMNEGVETTEEYDELTLVCGSLPEFDPEDPESSYEEIREAATQAFDEYGLCLDGHVPDDSPSYFSWLLSTGGPQEEIRFYVNANKKTYSISFVYKNWFTFSEKILTRSEHPWVWDVESYFSELFEMKELDCE